MDVEPDRASALARLSGLAGRITADLDLARTLDAVCSAVVEALRFRVAVVNLVVPGGDYETVAVAGSDSAREALLGQRGSAADWESWMAQCERVGGLLVDYRGTELAGRLPQWVPDAAGPAPDPDDPRVWQPMDILLAPLWSPRVGALGAIGVDLPHDGLRPGPDRLELLEVFAAQATVAIENAQLHTALVARGAEQRQALDRLAALVSQAPVAILEVDLSGRVRSWNPAAVRIFGWTSDEVLGRANPIVDPAAYDAWVADLSGRAGAARRSDVRRRHKDGRDVDVTVSSAPLHDGDGSVTGYIAVFEDVTDRVVLERELRHAALHDPLTGLPNRALLRQQLERRGGGPTRPGALLLLDLDGFKVVNDTLGHGAGDLVLVEVARRLLAESRSGDVVARLGGDEFVMVVAQGEDVRGMADRLVGVLAEPVSVLGHEVDLGCSIGIKDLAADGSVDAVLRDADLAMYAAKALGKGGYRVFEPALLDAAVLNDQTVRDLRRAVPEQQLELRWHPVVDVHSYDVLGLEALLRWQHPVRGELEPAAFVAAAEQTGLVVPIGAWVLQAGCEQAQRWRREVPAAADLTVSVNVSPVQLRSPRIVDTVRAALVDSGLPPPALVLELTEDVLVDDVELAVATLADLRGLGVRLALDDFGAGYSSLRYLKRLPVDLVKLDRMLLDGLEQDPAALALVDGVLTLLRRLGLTAVAEGIDAPSQLAVLQALQCPAGQGYLFSPPLPAHAVPELLRVGRPSSRVPRLPPRR